MAEEIKQDEPAEGIGINGHSEVAAENQPDETQTPPNPEGAGDGAGSEATPPSEGGENAGEGNA